MTANTPEPPIDAEIPVVILCGGQGTRIREETEFRPKPMIEVGGMPILLHIMKRYGQFGFKHFYLCLGYKGTHIKDYFLHYRQRVADITVSLGTGQVTEYLSDPGGADFNVSMLETGLETMTGGRLARCRRHLKSTFMMTYGDGLADVDIPALLAFHRRHGRIATVTSAKVESRFGMLNSEAGFVKSFSEKPKLSDRISAGFFVFEPAIFDYLADGDSCVLETKPMVKLVEDGQLAEFRHDGFFQAMDTYRERVHLNGLWDKGTAPWKNW